MSTSTTSALNPSAKPTDAGTGFKGNDRLLMGIIMGVLAFWLFAQTTLNVAPDTLAFNVFMVLVAIMSIMLTVPKGKKT
jgi:hypothetical protein